MTQPTEQQPARDDLYDALDQSWYRWGPPGTPKADSLNRLIDAYRDEVAIDIGRDALRDGLQPFLMRLVGKSNAKDLLDAYRGAVLREAADALDADMERFFTEWPDEPRNSPYANGRKDVANDLRRMAEEARS